MMEANETADQFDELLSQLRIDEMNPVEVQESENVDTENLPHCSSCGGPIVGQVRKRRKRKKERAHSSQVLIAFNMPWHPEHLGCAVCGTPFTGGKRVMEGSGKQKKKRKRLLVDRWLFFELIRRGRKRILRARLYRHVCSEMWKMQ
jgi:ribosomal protein L37E